MIYTVLGAGGFIGNQLSEALNNEDGADVYAPSCRGKDVISDKILNRELGHVFYCIGLTANFRGRPYDTVESHVCLLRQLLEHGQFDTLTYLSSTRVYEGVSATGEDEILRVAPGNPGHLYNLSKLMGESLCLAGGRKAKVVRLSNVFGNTMPPQNFISQVLREASETGHVKFLTAPESSKDYVSVSDVVRWLPKIALHGKYSSYNIASGKNISNAEVAELLKKRGVGVSFAEDAPKWSFPDIDTRRLVNEFGVAQSSLQDEFDNLLRCFSNH